MLQASIVLVVYPRVKYTMIYQRMLQRDFLHFCKRVSVMLSIVGSYVGSIGAFGCK
jgi:hypothetical protein